MAFWFCCYCVIAIKKNYCRWHFYSVCVYMQDPRNMHKIFSIWTNLLLMRVKLFDRKFSASNFYDKLPTFPIYLGGRTDSLQNKENIVKYLINLWIHIVIWHIKTYLWHRQRLFSRVKYGDLTILCLHVHHLQQVFISHTIAVNWHPHRLSLMRKVVN